MRIATQLVASTALAAIIATAPVAVRVATAAPEAQGADATAITEVVVTARKREERLKDVPIAVTAVTSDTLDRQQIIAVKDIAAFAPGLNINTDSVGRAFISIRGVGATLIDTVQPGVGIFIDGVYAPNTSYLNSPLLDVERIEVLRGPQGTLFGNNTLGGAISVITRQPSDTYHVSLSGAAAGDDNYRSASGSVSGPIIKGVLQAKLGIAVHDQDGFEKNTIAGGDANPLHQKSANAALRWQAAPNAVFTLNGYYDQVRGGTTAYIDLTGPRDYSENASLNVNSIATYTYAGANLKGVIDLPGMNSTLTAVGAIDKRDGLARGDGDFGPFDFIRVVRGANKLITYTGEVRVDTKFNDHLSSLVGVFANQSTTDTNIDNLIVPFAVHSPKVDHAEVEAQAVYGTLFWKFDTIELATGLRLDHQQVVDTADPKKYDTTELEPRVTLTKHWSPNNMTYASISRGFRGGGANGPGVPNPIYQGDSVWTYEVGAKTGSDDHRLTADVALFYNDYEHFIGQNSLAPCGPTFCAINLNTGKVESYGLEIEAQYRPDDRWAFGAGLTLLNARITDGSEYVKTTGLALPSDRILFTPDWNFYTNASYTLPVGADDLRFDGTLVGKGQRIGSTLSAASVPVLQPYYLVNASATYTHGRYQVALFATNLGDTKYLESYLDKSLLTMAGFPAALSNNLGIQGDRRRVGVRASYKF